MGARFARLKKEVDKEKILCQGPSVMSDPVAPPPPEALATATLQVLSEFLKLLDERQAWPPKTPTMKDYSRGYRDALLDLRIELKKNIEAGIKISDHPLATRNP